MEAMDDKKCIPLKKEEKCETSNEFGCMALVFPSIVKVKEDADEGVKEEFREDPDMKLDVDDSEHNFLEHPLDECSLTECTNGCPGLTLGWDETENNNSLSALLDAVLEAENGWCPPPLLVPEVKLESTECKVQIDMIPVTVVLVPFIPKEELGIASTRYECDSARFICVGETCGIYEEIVHQGVVHAEHPTGEEISTLLTVFGNHRQELTIQQGSSLCLRKNCSLEENEFQEFCCNFCQQCFLSKYRLIMHVFTHIDGVQPPVYVCKSCGEVFPSNDSLNQHLMTSIGDKALSMSHNEKLDCNDKHENVSNLEGDHKSSNAEKINKQSPCQEIQKTSNKSHFNNGPHKCDICGKSFTRPYQIKRHSVLHTKEMPHKCEICGKSFRLLKYLRDHAYTHSEKRRHKCDICGMSYRRLSVLRTHLLRHSGIKPYKCDICGSSFFRPESLKTHAFKHSGVKQYKCDICQKAFAEPSGLKKHSVIHTGEKPHRCNTCGKSFTLRGNLKQHIVIHSGNKSHKCEVCGKAFFSKYTHKKHVIAHTKNRPHKCDVCGKSFYHMYALNRHAVVHTGMYPHKCDICGKSFARLSQLKRHELKHS